MPGSAQTPSSGAAGFTLVEVLLALFLLSISLLAIAPMFIYALQESAAGGAMGQVGAAAVERMEQIRGQEYDSLPTGGSLTVNQSGFSDTTIPDVVVRWQIVDNSTPPNTKTITLRALAAEGAGAGLRPQVTLTTLRSK